MEISPPLTDFKDRKTGLTVFGFFTILIGAVCALFVPLMIFSQTMAAKSGAPQNSQAIIPAIGMYGVLAVALVWLGVGSMMARRWARALLLIFSWAWLITGVISIFMMAFMLPRMSEVMEAARPDGQPPIPTGASSGIFVIMLIVMGIIFILVPCVWVLFYQSRHVKATCDALDPTERWTDRCPLPVLAISIWLALCTPMMLFMPFLYRGVVPFFGEFISGLAGSACYIAFAAMFAYCAWAFYTLNRRGWWMVCGFVLIFSISSFITYSRHDISELSTLMGYPAEQIAQLQKFNFFQGRNMAWFSVIGMAPMLGYLIYVRKFFPPRV